MNGGKMAETVAAISTPNAAGGIGMIRISGEDATMLAEQIFHSVSGRKVTEMRGYTCAYGTIADGDEVLDDVVLTVFRAPHSYTGEDVVEITCHGGVYLCRRILALLYRVGALPAGAGEFTKRAYLNGKISLSQAEAVMDVIAADGEITLKQANYARSGRLSQRMRSCSEKITALLSAFAYWMDDPEEFPPELQEDTLISELGSICGELQKMQETYRNGKVFREGIRTVLLGLPNAGKSSVMNWLSGTRRSIVTDIAGTTRDVVTEQVRFGEYTLLLADTAGIREASNPIETIGIEAAFSEVQQSVLILYVVDASVGLTAEDEAILHRFADKKQILLWNKNDLAGVSEPPEGYPTAVCAAKTGDGEENLLRALTMVYPVPDSSADMTILNERQSALIAEASASLNATISDLLGGQPLDMVYQDLESAANALFSLDGENVSEDVVNGVFSKFCVGK